MQLANMKEPVIDSSIFKKTGLVIRALNNPLRQKIISFIDRNEKVDVTSIYKNLKLEQSVTSTHLAILRRHGFVNSERQGQYVYYSVNYKLIQGVQEHANQILKKVNLNNLQKR
jgi:ArsR family transcriptional regulator, virulence genes transcriptional regulator